MRAFVLLILGYFTTLVVLPNEVGTDDQPTLRAANRMSVAVSARCSPQAGAPAIPDLKTLVPSSFSGPAVWRSPRTVANLQVGDILTI